MQSYRLTRRTFEALDGEGARINGGRWNTAGHPVVYSGSSRSLVALEYLIHIDIDDVPDDLVLLTIDIPDDLVVEHVTAAQLPGDWRRAEHPRCQALGDEWLARGEALVLRAPSAAMPEEDAVLLNPRHSAMRRVRILDTRDFVYDDRLLSG